MMNRKIAILLTFASISLLATVMAQPRGWNDPQSVYNRIYNPYTLETLNGEVTAIDTFVPSQDWYAGVHITLKTDKESIGVHIGPQWYVDNQDFNLSVGDAVQVTGSRVVYEGREVIIAQQIRKGNEVLMLRYANGFPYWSGSRRTGR